MIYYYYYLLWLFRSCCSSISTSTSSVTNCSRTCPNKISSVSQRSDHHAHTLHTPADHSPSLQTHHVSHQRHHSSHQTTMNITSPQDITTRSQWHAWFVQKRQRLLTRLEQAQQAERNWPSTRRGCDIMRIQNEIHALNTSCATAQNTP